LIRLLNCRQIGVIGVIGVIEGEGNDGNDGTPTQLFTKIKNRLNLPEQRFHDLRHFHATQLLKAGTPLHVVAHRLGHRDPMVTATTYAHITADQAVNVSVVFAKAVE